jgi:hypothetical protein
MTTGYLILNRGLPNVRPKGRRCPAGLRLGHAVKGLPGIPSLATQLNGAAGNGFGNSGLNEGRLPNAY